MSIVYKDVHIICSMSIGTTNIVAPYSNVVTENSITRLLVSFPDDYEDYVKIIDISYTDVNGDSVVEGYEMSYSDELESYYFIINRTFTYGNKIYIQFRARHPSGQEAVDSTIITVTFRRSIKTENLEEIDSDPSDEQTVILQGFVTEHAVVNASSLHSGHVKIDNDTITMNEDGIISATGGVTEEYVQIMIASHADIVATSSSIGHIAPDNSTIGINEYGVISVKPTNATINVTMSGGDDVVATGTMGFIVVPYDCTIQSWMLLSEIEGSISIDILKSVPASFPSGVVSICGTHPTLTASAINSDNILSGWTTELSEGDILIFYIESVESIITTTISLVVLKEV